MSEEHPEQVSDAGKGKPRRWWIPVGGTVIGAGLGVGYALLIGCHGS